MESIDRFTQRTEIEPYFAGCWIARHARENSLSRAELAAKLGIDEPALSLIRQCRKPDTREEAETIAERLGPPEWMLLAEWLCEVCEVGPDAE